MAEARILLVEDSATYAELATMLLEAAGYTVVRAATAQEGLRLARDASPSLILMDMNLPGMDGLHAVQLLRADPRTSRIPTVGLTADRIWSEQERERARAAGFDAYVEKPSDASAFHAMVAPFLGPPEAR